jgi:hypothetical protein
MNAGVASLARCAPSRACNPLLESQDDIPREGHRGGATLSDHAEMPLCPLLALRQAALPVSAGAQTGSASSPDCSPKNRWLGQFPSTASEALLRAAEVKLTDGSL